MKIDGNTQLYGIIGNPVKHSLSPLMHNAAFEHLGENSVYLPFAVSNVGAALEGIKHLPIKGLSVTIPHKEAVIPFLDKIDAVAKNIGAVNTIICEQKGDQILFCGSNTDWLGANRALAAKMKLKDATVVILGAGGSARAIGFGLIEAGATITLCSRTEARGRKLAEDLQCPWHSLDDVETLYGDALVNSTSVGMAPQEQMSLVPEKHLGNYKVVMDIVYVPLQTKLLESAKNAGCRTVSGLDMLLYQGVAQFELWTGLRAPEELMRQVLYRETGNGSKDSL